MPMNATNHWNLLGIVAIGDVVIAAILIVAAAALLRSFLRRLVERHPHTARELFEPAQGLGLRLYEYLKARRSRELNDPRAHALAFSAYVCVLLGLLLVGLAVLTLIASFII